MNLASRLSLAFQALRELGPSQLGLYALYQLGLKTGHYRRQLNAIRNHSIKENQDFHFKIHNCLPALPERGKLIELLGEQTGSLFAEADEIVGGQVHLFGGQPVPLVLATPEPPGDWTEYESGKTPSGNQDIKFTWEPGRFAWAYTLARAYHLSGEERYAESFWHYTETFLTANPPYLGPHWSSAQEVALRLVALSFTAQVFFPSRHTSPERLDSLAHAIAAHAERIPPTLPYARSQNNNHLISEALGLYTASAALPDHPSAPKWHKLGWTWLKRALRTQISQDGSYTQHSTNYHRLMLQAALWALAVQDNSFPDQPIPPDILARLGTATIWLWKLVDGENGHVPNLGHNDGAYILPLTVCPQHDFRPVIYAAARRFLTLRVLPEGVWNEMAVWLCQPPDQDATEAAEETWHTAPKERTLNTQAPHVLRIPSSNSWAYLRVAKFNSRPAHADQLHLDLWWHGLNLTQDPGTYLYNAPAPWDNSLMNTIVHNTVMVDGQEQMRRAGRFLYLDWAQAKVTANEYASDGSWESVTAEHDGYRKMGITHQRKVTAYTNGHWEIMDQLNGASNAIHTARLQWLLPDWEYELQEGAIEENPSKCEIRINSPLGWITLITAVIPPFGDAKPPMTTNVQLVCAGKLVFGSGTALPILGWTSPTFGNKIPALAFIFEITQTMPITLKSEWILPHET